MIKTLLNRIEQIKKYCKETVLVLILIGKEIDTVKDALEKADKYRWHDMRIDPDDKPDSKRFVEVRTDDSFPYYFGWYDTESDAGAWYDAAGFSMNPYKWREIEEEVEEC